MRKDECYVFTATYCACADPNSRHSRRHFAGVESWGSAVAMSGFNIFRSSDRPLPNRSTNFNYAIYVPDAGDTSPVDFVDQICGVVEFGACGRQGTALYCAVCFKSKVGYHRVCKSVEGIFPDITDFVVKSPMKLKPLGYIDAIRNDCDDMIVYEGGVIVEGREKNEELVQEEKDFQSQEEPIVLKEESTVPTGRKRRRKQDKRLVHRQPPSEEGGLVIDEGLEEYYTPVDGQKVPSFGEDVNPSAKTWTSKESDQDIVEGTNCSTAAQYHLEGKGWIPIAPKLETPDVGDCSMLASANINIGVIQPPDRPSQETSIYSGPEAWSAVPVGLKVPSHDTHSEGYRCEICGAWFKTLRMRSSHITSCRYKDSLARDGRTIDARQRHLTKTGRGKKEEDDKASQPKKEYKCELCGKSFDRLRIRSSHMKSCREKGDRASEVWNKRHRGKGRGRKGKKTMKVRELLSELMEAKKDGATDLSKQELEKAVEVGIDSEEESHPKTKHSSQEKSSEHIEEEGNVQRVKGNMPDINVQGNAVLDISEQGNPHRDVIDQGKEQSMMAATLEKGDKNRSDEKMCETTIGISKESGECNKTAISLDQTKECEKPPKEQEEMGEWRLAGKLPLQQKNRKLLLGKSGLACPFCQAKFSCKQRYQTHLDSHSIPACPPSPFTCTKCSAPFQSRKDLKIHSKIHTRDGEHDCKVCGAKFRQRGSRDRHLRKIHPEFAQQAKLVNMECERRRKANLYNQWTKATSCYLCGKPVADIDEYKIHMKEHRDMKRDVESRPYQCLVCQARYRDIKTIQLHMRNHTGREWEWRHLSNIQNAAGNSNPSTVQPKSERTAEEREKDEDKLWQDLEKVVGLDLTQELKKHDLFKPQPKENNHKAAQVSPNTKPVQTQSSLKEIMVNINQPINPPRSDSTDVQVQENDSVEKPKVAPPVVTKEEGLQRRQKKRKQLHNIIANLKHAQVKSGQEGVRPSMEQQAEESIGKKERENVQIKEEPLEHVTEATPNKVSDNTEDPKDAVMVTQHGVDVPTDTEPNISSFHLPIEKTKNSVPTMKTEYFVSNTSPVPKPIVNDEELENLNTTLKAAIDLSKDLVPVSEVDLNDVSSRESSTSSAKEATSVGGSTEVKAESECDKGPSEHQEDSGTMKSVMSEAAASRNEAGGRGKRGGRGGKTQGRRGRRTGRNKSAEKETDSSVASDSSAPEKPTRGKRRASTSRGGPGKRQRRSPRTPVKTKEPREVTLTKKDHKKSLKKSPILLDLLGKSNDSLTTVDNVICTASSPMENSHAEGSVTVNTDVGTNTEIANKVVTIEGVDSAGQNVTDQMAVGHVHQKNCSCCDKSRQTILVGKELHLAFPNKVNMRAMVDQRPFYCNICGARYSEEATLRMHMRLHPPSSRPMLPLQRNEEGQFVCVVCGGRFNEKDELVRHSRIHPLLY
ncbi:uncharacterized protein LOC144887324 isoform X2 [Branchiostoma floridae x Branchiostoma japonicum]